MARYDIAVFTALAAHHCFGGDHIDMNGAPAAIAVRNLRKVYGAKAAVDGLTLTVPSGCFYGFLGPNGAGKTTTIRMLMGLAPPTSGEIEILGYRLPEQDIEMIALDFPSIPFVIPHFGAGFLREALMVADLCPNVYLDTSSSNSWVKYLSPEPSLREVFRRSLDVVGPKRLLFGTDSSFFPRGWVHGVLDEQSRVLYELAVPTGDVAAILGGNLQHLLIT